MSERMAILLTIAAGTVVEVVGLVVLFILGVRGAGLSLGAIIPLIVTSLAASRVVMHYDEPEHRR